MTNRNIIKTVTGIRTQDGAGVNLVRVISGRNTEDFDPFLMLDAFDSSDPSDYVKGFPWHPHRGIAVSYTHLRICRSADDNALANTRLVILPADTDRAKKRRSISSCKIAPPFRSGPCWPEDAIPNAQGLYFCPCVLVCFGFPAPLVFRTPAVFF